MRRDVATAEGSWGCNPCFKWDALETGRVDDARDDAGAVRGLDCYDTAMTEFFLGLRGAQATRTMKSHSGASWFFIALTRSHTTLGRLEALVKASNVNASPGR